ncbi:MAG TPA: glucose-1-phosphate adenylyltransferase [Candidatus Hydrogenedentes bacterium]|nr:glucose-1-phosphate adenylyltransferase [Candidatus Hydrogenedentota bacterium]
MDQVLALVLGGGRGTRLYPLTALRAKPAVPLMGRHRLVDIPLSNCIHSGVKHIFVLTQFNSASLHRHINRSYRFDTFSRGFIEILAAEQTTESGDWFQGTADAVRQNLRHLMSARAKYYLVLSGDQLYQMDYRELLATHIRNAADITVAALPVSREATSNFGILQVRNDGRIASFIEKPEANTELRGLATPASVLARHGLKFKGRRYLASMGVYVFSAKALEAILAQKPDWIDFGHDVVPGSLKKRRVFAHLFSGFWEDIGTVRSYYEVSMRMAGPHPPLELHDPRHRIYTHPRYLPGSRLQNASIKNSTICEGSHIGRAQITNSIIGIRSVIQHRVTISRSIVMGADFYETKGSKESVPVGIGRNSVISGAIVDKNARIGAGVAIRGSRRLKDQDGNGYAIRDGIVVVLKDAVIPDGTRIG